MLTDSELLRRYADEKSEEAFGELVRRQVNLVYSVALRQCGGDAHLAEDVAQRVFTDLARKARQLSGHAVLGGWLYRSAQFVASDVVRAERRRRGREQEAQAMQEISRPTVGDADWQQLAPVLDQAVGELAARDRDAVVLRFFEGRPFAEIGATLRVTEDAARMRVERALDKLRAVLVRRGITSTTAALGVALANQAAATVPVGVAASVTGAALAGAASGGGAAAILTFMSTTKMVAGIAGVAVLLALGTAVFEINAARESGAALESISGQRDELRARLAAMEQRTVQAEAGRTAMQAELDDLRASAGKTATNAGTVRPAARPSVAPAEYVLDHPEARPAYLQRAALTAKPRFDRFFRSAGLTGEQQDRFLRVTMNDADKWLEMLAIKRGAGGLDPTGQPMDRGTREQIDAVGQRRDAETTGELRELLGDRLPSLMEFMKTIPERNVVDQLAGQLYYTDSPLTAPQAEQLARILAENPFRPQATPSPTNTMGNKFIPREAFNGAMAQGMNFNGPVALGVNLDFPWMQDALVTDAAVARASTTLTPAQLAALTVLQAEQAARLQLAPPAQQKDGRRENSK